MAQRMSDQRPVINDHSGRRVPVPFRPGLRALTAVVFAGAVYFSVLTFAISGKLRVRIWEMWTFYAAIALALMGLLCFRLTYRKPTRRQ